VITKFLKFTAVVFILLAVAGCNWAFGHPTNSDGFDFSSDSVKKIAKGSTTDTEIIQLFGGPIAKLEYPQDEEEWLYYYTTDTEIADRDFLTDEAHSIIHRKSLRIRLKNGTVTNFKCDESSEPFVPGRA
jgi:outer membrane protein assembly factor BamE (lipoprotein component of BamABCDE complex)